MTCLSCGADLIANRHGRQLCHTCYLRAWRHNLHTRYPACGAVPVPVFDVHNYRPAPPVDRCQGAPSNPDWQRRAAWEQLSTAERWGEAS